MGVVEFVINDIYLSVVLLDKIVELYFVIINYV